LIEETVNGMLAADAHWITAVQTVPRQKGNQTGFDIHTQHPHYLGRAAYN